MSATGSSYLLDSSAVLALIEDELGAERVEEVLREENVFLPWMVLMEVFYISYREIGQAEAENRLALLKNINTTILWDMSEPTLLSAARLKAEHRVSVADAIIAAFAIQMSATLLHKDPEYNTLSGIVLQEKLPYK